MFQDDRMIPVLSAIVLLVAFGTVLQRVDGVDRWLGGDAAPEIVLRDDEVAAPTNALLRIDVFANDDGIDKAMRESLTVVTAPACGRLFIRSGLLEYMPDDGCAGRQTIRYSITGAAPDQVASVTAEIRGGGEQVPNLADATARAAPSADASPAVGPAGTPSGAGTPALAQADTPAPDPAGITPAPTEVAARAPAVASADGSAGGASSSGGMSSAPAAGEHGGPAQVAAAGSGAMPEGVAIPGPAAGAVPSVEESPSGASGPAGAVALAGMPTAGPVSAFPSRDAAPDAFATPSGARRPAAPSAARAASENLPDAGDPGATLLAKASPPAVAAAGPAAADPPATPLADPSHGAVGTGRPPAPFPGTDSVALAAKAAAPPSVGASEDVAGLAALPDGSPPEPTRGAAPARSSEGPAPSRAHETDRPGALTRWRADIPPDVSIAASSADASPETGAAKDDVSDTVHGPREAAPEDAARVAALPAPDAGAIGRAESLASTEPDRPDIRVAALLPPVDADRASTVARPGNPAEPHARPPERARPAVPGEMPSVAASRPPMPRVTLAAAGPMTAEAADESPVAAAAANGGPAFVLSVVGAANAAASTPGGAIPRANGPAVGSASGELRLAALAPARLLGPALPGPALDMLPVETEAPPALGRIVIPVPRPASLGGPGASADPETAALPEIVAPCVIVPGLTLDIRDAGTTILIVDAPCQAGTVAELTYSGLGLAVPLDGNGHGSVTVLGFEPNTPALVTFRDGTSLEFELPFRGVDRVSRVALAWDSAVELGLNALEHGAVPNTPGHVRPGAARSFEEVRQTGGGYLGVWWPVAGVGQSVQIYSWYHRSGETPGVVRMLVDFVSRDRDKLASACGDGPDAAPQFMVLRSESGRPDRPVIRRLAPIGCQQVADGGRDNRLISGAVDDLVITSR